MKKINIPIPDWVHPRRAIYVFAGMEIVAKKFPDGPMMIKTRACSRCGVCCKRVPENWEVGGNPAYNPETRACVFLKHDGGDTWLCSCALDRPFGCCIGDVSDEDFCAVEWSELDGVE